MRKRVGDTLVEVTLAVGIFSMIAIAIASVMSGGTSSTQTALETTLAREEIDEQAEALRFIQSSYIADKDTADKRFTDLWEKITSSAVSLGSTVDSADSVLHFAPTSCPDLYNSSKANNLFSQNAFVINPKALGTFTSSTIDSVFVSSVKATPKFAEASTYPRLIYNTPSSNDLVDEGEGNSLYRAEGIYVVAVPDNNTTTIVGSTDKTIPAFYDFYIRTCWYGSNANEPSTISTVIRLYNPKAVNFSDK